MERKNNHYPTTKRLSHVAADSYLAEMGSKVAIISMLVPHIEDK